MRKCILLLLLLSVFAATSFSQQTAPAAPERDYDYYINKSGRQKTAGWVLTSVGTAGLVFTLAKDVNRSLSFLFSSDNFESYLPYYAASGVAVVAGIFSFKAASKNKRKAAALQTTFKMERAPMPYSNGIGSKDYPSLSLTLAL